MKYEKELKGLLEMAKAKGLGLDGIKNLVNKYQTNPAPLEPKKPVLKAQGAVKAKK